MADDDEGSEACHAEERCDLLLKIKSTVDGLLANGSNVTWSTYGGLTRISDNVEQILLHGCRFVLGIQRNKQNSTTELFNSLKEISNSGQEDGENESFKQWIQKSLLSHALSVNLEKFVKNKAHLKHHYYKFAFVRSQAHFQALKHCLRAIEEDNPMLATTINQILLNKQRYVEQFLKSLDEGLSNAADGSSSEYTSANEDPAMETVTDNIVIGKDGETRGSNEIDYFSFNENDCDNFFLPKSSRNSMKTILATAAFNAATKPVDVQNEIRWFEGEVVETTQFEVENNGNKAKVEDTRTEGSSKVFRRQSNDSLSSTSTIDSLPFDSTKNNQGNKEESEHEKKKKIGHYRSKSDQFRSFRPFGTSKAKDERVSLKGADGDALSSSLPTNSDATEFYSGGLGSTTPSRVNGPPILGFLSSRQYDSCHEFDRENAHFSISEALISAIEQMKCETLRYSEHEEDDEDDDESDEEILKLRAKIKEKKMARKQHTRNQHSALLSDGDTRSSSTPCTKSTASVSSGSPRSSFSRDPPKSVDSDYNSSTESPSSDHSKTQKSEEKIDMVSSSSTLDTSSLEISSSPISAEQVALSLLQKVASRKNLTSADLKWMVSEQDVPQSLLPLPTAIPVSPDDELYDTNDNSRKTSLPCRLRGNLEWAPPRQQIIFNIPPNPRRKEAMAKQRYRCAGCGMRIDPGYVKRFRYCNYLGKYFCNTCHSNKPIAIPARIIHRWDFKEYEVSNFARDLLSRVHNDPLFNIMAINKTLLKRVKELDEIGFLRRQLSHLASFLRTCRYGEKLLVILNTLQSYIITETHLYSICDLLEVKSGVFFERLDRIVKQALEHVSSCQLCLAKGFICEYCKNGNDIIYPFEVKRCTQCSKCKACYHRECFVKEKCPKCERKLLRKQAVEKDNSKSGSEEEPE